MDSQATPHLLGQAGVLAHAVADVSALRERSRRTRLRRLAGALAIATAFLWFRVLTGHPLVGWILALIVAGLAGLAAATGICIGCEVYLFFARRRFATRLARRVAGDDGPADRLPAELVSGEATWVVFTTPEMPSRLVELPMPVRAAPMASISSMNPIAPPSRRAAVLSALKYERILRLVWP